MQRPLLFFELRVYPSRTGTAVHHNVIDVHKHEQTQGAGCKNHMTGIISRRNAAMHEKLPSRPCCLCHRMPDVASNK